MPYTFTLVVAAVLAAAPAAKDALSPAEHAAIMKALCTGSFESDAQGPICRDAEEFPDERLTELRWLSAHRGRFVAQDGEWLVSLQGLCLQGCAGWTYVVAKTDTGWKKLAEGDGRVGDACAIVSGMADGYDRVACVDRVAEPGGTSLHWLDVRTFAGGKPADERLLESSQGGECTAPDRPKDAELKADRLQGLKAGAPGSGVALSVVLNVRRRPCGDPAKTDPPSQAKHVLRFVAKGETIAPDDASSSIIDKYGWGGR